MSSFSVSGLLLPRVGVEHHGIERTDVGSLGSGIYFSDAVRLVYSCAMLLCGPEQQRYTQKDIFERRGHGSLSSAPA